MAFLFGNIVPWGGKKFLFFSCAMLLLLGGCRRSVEGGSSGGELQAEKVYFVETADLQITPKIFPAAGSFYLADDSVYFMDTGGIVYREALFGEEKTPVPVIMAQDGQAVCMSVGAQGEITCIVQEPTQLYWAKTYAASGEELSAVLFQDMENNGENIHIKKCVRDQSGMFYILTSDRILKYAPDGKAAGEILSPAESFIDIGLSGEGKVYASYIAKITEVMLTELSADGGGTDMAKKIPGNGKLYPGEQTGFFLLDTRYLYAYHTGTGEYRVLADWTQHYVNAALIQVIAGGAPNRLLAVSWNDIVPLGSQEDSGGQPVEWKLFTETTWEEKQAAEREKKKLGIFAGENPALRELVVNFNKEHENLQIELEEKAFAGTEEAELYLNTRLVGRDAPDLLLMDYPYFEKYQAAGILADLTPYMQNSAYAKECFLEEVIRIFERGEGIYAIPREFSVSTLVGRASHLESFKKKKGISIGDYVDWLEKNPDIKFTVDGSRIALLQQCLKYGLSNYVNLSDGSCQLDGEAFKSLLLRLEKLRFESVQTQTERDDALQAGGIVIDNTYLNSFYDLEKLRMEFGADVALLGFPESDENLCTGITSHEVFGILAKSENKEASWEFIKYYMENYPTSSGFPALRETYEERKKEAQQKQYEKDENGKKFEAAHRYMFVRGEPVEIYAVSKKQVQQIDEAVMSAKSRPAEYDRIMGIIIEEYLYYLNGEKSLDECLQIMQSRVRLYLAE